MRNRIEPYLSPLPDREGLADWLWSGAHKALLIGDLYLEADPTSHDAAIGLGTDLAELAEALQDAPPETPGEHASRVAAVRQAMSRAELVLARLAPFA
jgi:hypothetical protein